MKIRNTKLSKRTLALLTATALLFGSGSFAVTKAELTYFSNEYTAGFELNHLQVHLIENGQDVCHDNNKSIYTVHRTDDKVAQEKKAKYRGNLVEYLGYENEDSHYGNAAAYTLGTPGRVEPGRTYKEELSARNGNNVDEYVRIIIRKYWVDSSGSKGKSPVRDPSLIELTYNGQAYNSSAWAVNSKEHTQESDTYYLKSKLSAGATSALLFNELKINKSVADLENPSTTTKTETIDPSGNKVTVITYGYDYDDFTFYIEADVQAIQTHNASDALRSMWGVSNVSAGNGTLTVR